MDMTLNEITSNKNFTSNFLENPEEDVSTDDIKCRICYDNTRPLISVCGCSGSIAFVHEDCILDWITKKIEAAAIVQIPLCEICH